MRYFTPFLLVLPFILSACSSEDSARQQVRNASYPALLPLSALEIEEMRSPGSAETLSVPEATVGELADRAEDLRRRAAALANEPIN
jgi:uncharacterized lipoprotein